MNLFNKKTIIASLLAVLVVLAALILTKSKTARPTGQISQVTGSRAADNNQTDPISQNAPAETTDQSTTAIPKISALNSQEKSLSDTAKFSRNLFGQYLETEKNGDYLAVDYSRLLFDAVNQASSSAKFTEYDSQNFKTIAKETSATGRTYGNALGQAIKKNTVTPTENEMVILERAQNNDDQTELQKLDPVIKKYRGIQSDLLEIPVPASALTIHKKLVNVFGVLVESVEGMKLAFSDPIRATQSVSLYPSAADLLVSTLKELRSYFKGRGIVFRPSEDGYLVAGGI
jgi:hypothetical protein